VDDEIDPFDRLRGMDPGGERAPGRPRPGHPLVGRVQDRVAPWIAWFGLRRVLATVLVVAGVVIGGWWLLRAPAPPTEAGLPLAAVATTTGQARTTTSGPAPPATTAGTVVVHVAGAVAAPGVYALDAGARTGDAVTAAGGAAPGAVIDALNLAAPLRDGERVYVPVVGEPVPAPVAPPPGTVAVGPLDLNRATAAELDALPGVGPATAAAIVAHREANGPFPSVDDLEQVRGIGPAKLDGIRPLVTV
jgi:competence protein ComEA